MRTVRVNDTRGSAWGELRALDGWLEVADHWTGRLRRMKIPAAYDGHGGGEVPLFRDFLTRPVRLCTLGIGSDVLQLRRGSSC